MRDGYRMLDWCRGLPFITKIRISPGEIGRLHELARREITKACLIVLAFIVAGIIGIPLPLYLTHVIFPGYNGPADIALFVAMILFFLIVVPIGMSVTGWPLKRALLIRKDLLDGHALLYAGRRHEINALKLWPLLRQTTMMADGDVVLVVLPESGLLASVNWKPAPASVYVYVELLPEPLPIDNEQSVLQLTGRVITETEHAELRTFGARMVKQSILQAIVVGVTVLSASNRFAGAYQWIWDDVYIAAAILTLGYWARRAWRFRKAADLTIMAAPAFPADDRILHDRSGAYKSGEATNRWQGCYFIQETLPDGSTWSVNNVVDDWRKSN